jgi:hypothetical protein
MPIASKARIETAPSFDRNWYRLQTVLQTLLAFALLAGLAGLFGGGWLSSDVVKIGSFEIRYDRFARKTVPFRITLTSDDNQKSGPLKVTLGRELVEKVAIIRTIPTASSSKDTTVGTEFEFESGGSRAQVVISLQPDRFGVFSWKLTIAGVGEASLFQVIYP